MDGPVTQEATEVDDGRSGTVIWRRSPEAKAKRLVRQLARLGFQAKAPTARTGRM